MGVLTLSLGLLMERVDFCSLFVVLDRSNAAPASQAKEIGVPVIA